jgi:photoactive yellow protein
VITLAAEAEPAFPPRPTEISALDQVGDAELDLVPFGVVCVDAAGTILRYNLAEARLARLDRNQVLGKNFFRVVAPCTATPEFEGRFQQHVASGSRAVTRFEYLFDFKFGAQQVDVEVVTGAATNRFYLCINRRKFFSARAGLPEGFAAPLQKELAPGEEKQGVLREEHAQRTVHVGPQMLGALRVAWDRVAPKGWGLFCGEWGTHWGRLTVVDLEAQSLEESGKSLRELPIKAVMEKVAHHLKHQGWGAIRVDFSASPQGAFVVEMDRSALAESVGISEIPRCHVIAGFLRANFSHLAGRLITVRELRCRAQGHAQCTFIAVSQTRKAQLDAAVDAVGDDVTRVLGALQEAGRGRG